MRRVLAVTLQQLAEVGYERLSIPEVATKAELNKTSVYRRWPTKKGLVRDALSQSMEPTEDIPNTGSLRSDLLVLAGQTSAFIQSALGKGLLRVIFAEGPHPDIRELVASAAQQQSGNAIHQVIQRAADRGELRADVDAELILFTLAGALMHRVFVEQRPIGEADTERLVDLVLCGALARGA